MKSPVTSITDEQLAEIEALAIKAPETTGDLYLYANTMTPSLLFSLTSRLRAAEADDWMPIESAPLDGSEILLMRGERVTSGAWIEWTSTYPEYHSSTGAYLGQSEQDSGASWASWDGGFTEEEPPTHWKRLPKPKNMENNQ